MKKHLAHPLQKRAHYGYLAIAASLLVSYALWIGHLWWHGDWYEDLWKYPAKVGSHGATLLMCWAFLLATRFRPIERLFGGLDKVYRAHRIIGEAAFFLILIHPLGLSAHRLPDLAAWAGYFLNPRDAAIMTGVAALAGFVVLVALSLYVKIPYDRWKRTHDWFGVLFVIVVAHGILARGEIMAYPALQIWFGIWAALGLSAYVYIRLLYRWIGPQFNTEVAAVELRPGDITEIVLKPVGRPMPWQAGQFLYVSFDADAVTEEPHPFTISNPPGEETVRLSIKHLGDWTKDTEAIRPGEYARLWGPYGHFADALWEESGREAVLIAGGIGVTPFLSMAGCGRFRERSGRSWLIYSVPTAEKAAYREELRERAEANDALELVEHYSEEEGYIDRSFLEEVVGELKGKTYFVCGPTIMMRSIQEFLLDAGVPLRDIHLEDFSLV
ncbi:MAG: hypothetical protein EA425_01630 [Puniceicoccaceae bacterium]|nr:MAG: hypothetical protein EA425_01630 [Puniceicoccaceae bacterium]